MPTTYLDHDPSSASYDIFQGLNTQISGMAAKRLKEQEEKKKIQQAIQEALLNAALKNMQLKKGADLSQMDTSQGMQGILGQIPGMFEQAPNYSQMKSALGMQNLSRQMENQRRLGVMAGQEAPSEEEMASFPPILGGAEGGKVMLPKEAIFGEGQITSPTGERIGEYLPGYEPKTLGAEDVAGAMREKFAGGISKEDLQRKALGIPFTGVAAKNITPSQALSILSDPFKSQEFKRKYPELYPLLEEIAKQALTGKTRFQGQSIINNENDILNTNW